MAVIMENYHVHFVHRKLLNTLRILNCDFVFATARRFCKLALTRFYPPLVSYLIIIITWLFINNVVTLN